MTTGRRATRPTVAGARIELTAAGSSGLLAPLVSRMPLYPRTDESRSDIRRWLSVEGPIRCERGNPGGDKDYHRQYSPTLEADWPRCGRRPSASWWRLHLSGYGPSSLTSIATRSLPEAGKSAQSVAMDRSGWAWS